MAQRVLVCVPVDLAQAALVAAGQPVPGPLQVFEVNADLLAGFGLTAADDEVADYACLLLAGLWGLVTTGRRLVLTAQIDPGSLGLGAEPANGGRSLDELAASRVEAFFADGPDAPTGELARAMQGWTLDDAWSDSRIEQLHRDHDLMWHSIVELPAYLAAQQEGA